jgi:hypothetical protein
MSTHYDAIFKDLLTHPRSVTVQALTGKPRGQPLPTDAGWYTGRSVDYISELSEDEFVHIEVQTSRNATMHWRMLNYSTLLHHKLHKWERNDVRIHQYLIYLGLGTFGLDGTHPAIRDEYAFKVLDLSQLEVPIQLTQSKFHGDHVVRLLMSDQPRDQWLALFDAICGMRSDPLKLDALFILHQLAGLRKMRPLIEDELEKASLYEALRDSPLTKRAAERVAKGEALETLNRLLRRRGDHELDADQRERLDDEQVTLADVRILLDEVMDGVSLRDAFRNSGLGPTW